MLGDDAEPTYEQVRRLTYVAQILDETLRMWPTAPIFTRAPRQDTVLVGQYAIPAGTAMSVLIPGLHRDRSVWGADADEFNPDHFSAEHKPTIPPNAYKPFGFGMRSCIGRQFALQEATLVLGMLLQRFEFIDHRNYQLHTLTALTIKPQDLYIKIRRRTDRNLVHRESGGRRGGPGSQSRSRAGGGRARHPAAGAVRVEPGHRGGDREQAGRRGHRTRIPGDGRRLGRPRRAVAHRRCGRRGLRVLQRAAPGECARAS